MPPKKSKAKNQNIVDVDNTSEDENKTSTLKRVSCAKSFLFSNDERGHIWRNLISWYDKNKKDLPWRKTIKRADDDDEDVEALEELHQRAYEVLVSEIMLQQTQVETVKTYFLKWMKRFPTVKDLADATVDDAVGVWSGLGYYRRARYLYNAAKYVVEKINKPIKNEQVISDDEDNDEEEEKKRIIYKLPDNVKDLMKLPGVGRYTAGAIASIAFSRTASVVDGNVFRVFARLKRVEEDIAVNKTANTVFWPMADNLIQHYRDIEDTVLEKEDLEIKHRYNVTGDFNQAIMELGRTVCTPRNPKCTECPLAEVCEANKALEKEEIATVEIYPVKNKKTKKRTQVVSCCIFYKDGDVDNCLFEKRPKETLLGGTWHFPFVIIQDTKAEEEDNEQDSDEEEGSKKKKTKKQTKKTKGSAATASSSESEHFVKLKEFLVKEGFVQDKSIPFEYHASVDHVFTHINQTNHIYSCSDKHLIKDLEESSTEEDQWKWFSNSQRKSKGISTVASKIFKQFKKTFKNQDASPITPPKVRFKTKSPFKSPEVKEEKSESSESSSEDEEVIMKDDEVKKTRQEVKEKVKEEIKQAKMETRLSKRVAKRTSEESTSANETPTKKKKQTSISSFFKK